MKNLREQANSHGTIATWYVGSLDSSGSTTAEFVANAFGVNQTAKIRLITKSSKNRKNRKNRKS